MDRADREIVKMQAAVIAAGIVQTHAQAPEVTARMSIQIVNAINQQVDAAEPEPAPLPPLPTADSAETPAA